MLDEEVIHNSLTHKLPAKSGENNSVTSLFLVLQGFPWFFYIPKTRKLHNHIGVID